MALILPQNKFILFAHLILAEGAARRLALTDLGRRFVHRNRIVKPNFLTKAAQKAQSGVDWVVLGAFALGVAVILLTSVGGLLNGLSLSVFGEVHPQNHEIP